MSSHRSASSDETKSQHVDGADKENIERKPELAADPEVTVAPSPSAQEQQWVTGFKLFNIITAVALVCLLMLLDTSIISTAIPRITSEFHSLVDVGWYGSAYQLSSAALQPLTGRIYMNLNTKWTFVGFFFIFELGSLICGIATSSKMLIVGRAVAGIGGAGILNGAFTIVSGCVPMSRRPTIIGLVMGVSQVGLAAGPLVGGALTEYSTWRWCFYINLPIGGLVGIMLAFVNIPEVLPKKKFTIAIRELPGQLDLIGFALFAPSAIQLLLALQYGGNQFTWHSSQVIGLFCGAGATFIAFLLWDYKQGDKAMIPFSMIRKRVVWSSSLAYGLLMAQVFCVLWYLPQYFQAVKNDSPLMSGVHILPSILAHLCGAVLAGKIIERVGYYLPIMLFATSLTTVSNGLLSTFSPDTSTGKWIGYQILLGASRSLGVQIPVIAVQNILPPAQIPVATALVMFSQTLAGGLFLTFSDTILTNSLSTLIPKYAPSVDAKTIIHAGPTEFRSYVTDQQLPGVVLAYAKSVDRVFYLTTATAAGSFFFSCFMGWKDIRKKKIVSKA
ncbi:major facilitator superfamily domain-containing protein [Aspergillus pseudonomiae]|uniref:Major facilitator superfamily domain-containing protein n=1 Tax=Aspergillus pseudonomiae TaxID=1506151 RepID=A0A5N7DKN9_9EURO|nr:major facilitator superfamily domain-containing protein [Aspergillus pseudonomiae]KAE8406865.1 major facilitator superfamily domain-containing protein [Aspergillus pseudonomiae]